MRNYIFEKKRVLVILLMGVFITTGQAQCLPDALPVSPKEHQQCAILQRMQTSKSYDEGRDDTCLELTIDNLLSVLELYGVKHKYIVAAQAILETGHFTSEQCLINHNLFGLRHPSDGSYYTFDTWEESVRAYRDDVQYKYSGGDYYAFLNRIGYAEDKRYTYKVRRIQKKLAPTLFAQREELAQSTKS